jgi:drug/metabolite transporter (DMT)-like permease
MHYLVLCILSSTGIFVVFKFLDRKNIAPYPVIVINYLVASIFGFLINSADFSLKSVMTLPWLPISLLIGVLFILMFFVIARSSQVAGISTTTVASKMSVVFPIVFSMIIDPTDSLTLTKIFAIITALIGVLLTVYSPGSNAGLMKKITLPLVLFIGMGIVDSLVKYAQHHFVENPDRALFSAILFFIAFLTGVLMLPFRKGAVSHFKKINTWLWGIGLGIFNFGSIYLMVSALNFVNAEGLGTDSSIIFGMNNIGIVSLSVLAGVLIFTEKLKTINWVGIALSVIAIILFTIT